MQESGYHPHGVCYLWETDLVWTHVAADGLIALAYYSIPIGLLWFVRRRRDIPFDWMFVAFAIFILACGTTHVMAIWTLWNPDYWASAWVKVVTAGASVATAGLMIPLLPKALRLPSPTELREKNRELAQAKAENDRLNERLREKVALLEVANADLEAFAYSISHDLKAPLRAMEGFSVALQEDCAGALDEECLDYTQRIAGASERMGALIDDLLQYSQLALKEIRPSQVALQPLLEDVVASLADTIDQREAEVRVEPTDAVVRAHRSTLTNMILNLTVNALTYVEPGTSPRIRIRAETAGSTVRIVVADNGIGIAPEHRERIFRIFERLHGVEEYSGTGIGLAAVAKGAERLGGKVGVRSEPGEGSEFWIELPREDEA